MHDFTEDILTGILSNFLFALLIIFIGWLTYYFTERRKLLKFFGISSSKRLVIYISNLRITQGGSIGIDGKSRSFSGTTVVYREQLMANAFRERFNYLVPSLSDSKSFFRKILFADIDVTILTSPIKIDEIESNSSILSFGSPGYNIASKYIEEDDSSTVQFENDNSEIGISNLPKMNDSQIGFIQRLNINRDNNQRSLFYTAGLTEQGTIGAAFYLLTNWKKLRKKYKDEDSFVIVLRFPSRNIGEFTIDLERKIE